MHQPARRLLVALTALLFTGCETLQLESLLSGFQQPEITNVKTRLQGIDFDGVELLFDVDVRNPYSFNVKSPGFDYNFKVKGAEFLQSAANTELNLPAKQTGTVTLPVKVGYLELWNAFQNLRDEQEAPYQLSGNLLFPVGDKMLKLPLSKSGSFPVLHLPRISIESVQKPNISLSGGALTINGTMGNPNSFAFNPADFGYAFKMGDLELAGLKLISSQNIEAGKTGAIALQAEIAGIEMLRRLIQIRSFSGAKLVPSGALKTPYGPIQLPRK